MAFTSTNFGNFGLGPQPMKSGFLLRETPRILDRQYREDMLGAYGDVLGGLGMGGLSGSASGSASGGGGDTSGYGALSDSLLGELQGAGDSQREKINRSFDTSLDSSLARLSDRGWGNSSLVESTEGASQRNRQSSLSELEDNLLQQRVGVKSQIGLAGLNAQQQNQRYNQQYQQQIIGNLFGGLFG